MRNQLHHPNSALKSYGKSKRRWTNKRTSAPHPILEQETIKRAMNGENVMGEISRIKIIHAGGENNVR